MIELSEVFLSPFDRASLKQAPLSPNNGDMCFASPKFSNCLTGDKHFDKTCSNNTLNSPCILLDSLDSNLKLPETIFYSPRDTYCGKCAQSPESVLFSTPCSQRTPRNMIDPSSVADPTTASTSGYPDEYAQSPGSNLFLSPTAQIIPTNVLRLSDLSFRSIYYKPLSYKHTNNFSEKKSKYPEKENRVCSPENMIDFSSLSVESVQTSHSCSEDELESLNITLKSSDVLYPLSKISLSSPDGNFNFSISDVQSMEATSSSSYIELGSSNTPKSSDSINRFWDMTLCTPKYNHDVSNLAVQSQETLLSSSCELDSFDETPKSSDSMCHPSCITLCSPGDNLDVTDLAVQSLETTLLSSDSQLDYFHRTPSSSDPICRLSKVNLCSPDHTLDFSISTAQSVESTRLSSDSTYELSRETPKSVYTNYFLSNVTVSSFDNKLDFSPSTVRSTETATQSCDNAFSSSRTPSPITSHFFSSTNLRSADKTLVFSSKSLLSSDEQLSSFKSTIGPSGKYEIFNSTALNSPDIKLDISEVTFTSTDFDPIFHDNLQSSDTTYHFADSTLMPSNASLPTYCKSVEASPGEINFLRHTFCEKTKQKKQKRWSDSSLKKMAKNCRDKFLPRSDTVISLGTVSSIHDWWTWKKNRQIILVQDSFNNQGPCIAEMSSKPLNGCVLSGASAEWGSAAALPNVLKVFLENGQTKSFKYDSSTTVGDVLKSLQTKLCFKETNHFALVLEQVKTLKRNKLTLLNPTHTLARVASRPGTHNLRCLFRVAFVPNDPCDLAQKDLSAFEYFYLQCCNDVVQERYAPELKYDTALRLAALHIHQHCLANNIQPSKITVKGVEKEFGLEKFVPGSLLETMKRKELRKVLTHLLKLNYTMTGTSHKCLTALQAKLYYLTIISQLPSYGAKCFPTSNQSTLVAFQDANVENVLLVSPKLGICQINGIGGTNMEMSSQPVPVAETDQLSMVQVEKKDHLLSTVTLVIPTSIQKEVAVTLEERDAEELVLVLQGYFKLLTEKDLCVQQDPDDWDKDAAPLYHSQHAVKPALWSYGSHALAEGHRIANLAMPPPTLSYASQNGKLMGNYSLTRNGGLYSPNGVNGLDNNMNVPGKVRDRNGLKMSPGNTGIDLHSVLSMDILEQHQNHAFSNDAKGDLSESVNDALNSLDLAETESESDSLTTSPSHNSLARNDRDSGSSFGLHSPDNLVSTSTYEALQEVWRRMKENPDQPQICLDPDIIDLTLLPPPVTPDKDLRLRAEELLSLDLEEFLASTQVAPPPPIAQVDPSLTLTTEQISAFIIPPPPAKEEEDDNKDEGLGAEEDERKPEIPNGKAEPIVNPIIPERPPKVTHKTPPPLPPRSDSFNKKQFLEKKEADGDVEAIKVTTELSDKLSLEIAQAERSVNSNQEVKDMLGLELRRLVTTSKCLVRSHKCASAAQLDGGDFAGNLHSVLSQLRKAVEYGITMEQKFLVGVLQVVNQLQAIIVAENMEDLSSAAEKLANVLAQLIKDCQSS